MKNLLQKINLPIFSTILLILNSVPAFANNYIKPGLTFNLHTKSITFSGAQNTNDSVVYMHSIKITNINTKTGINGLQTQGYKSFQLGESIGTTEVYHVDTETLSALQSSEALRNSCLAAKHAITNIKVLGEKMEACVIGNAKSKRYYVAKFPVPVLREVTIDNQYYRYELTSIDGLKP
jgi:hypothetical protein